MVYIPRETLAREEAREIASSLPTSLGSLVADQLIALEELLADAYAKGLDVGMRLSGGVSETKMSLTTALDIYNAGITEGKRGDKQ